MYKIIMDTLEKHRFRDLNDSLELEYLAHELFMALHDYLNKGGDEVE